MLKNKKNLVTGATGFVGSCLVRRLVKNSDKVHIILRRNSDTWRIKDIFKKTNPHYLDLNNAQMVKKTIKEIKPEVIYHLAAYGNYLEESRKNLETNIFGTLNLLEACHKIGYDIFVNTGSSSEYGAKSKPMSEKDLLEPNSYYAVAKAGQSLLCQHLARERKLPVITLRLFSVYGPYEGPKRLVPTLVNNCLRGKDLSLTSPKTARDFIFVDDVVEAYLKAAQSPNLAGHIFNIGTGEQSSLEKVVSIIIKLTDVKVEQNWGNMSNRSFDTNTWLADISKARRILKWQPKHNLEKGLSKTISWFKMNSQLYQ